jgi:hypothetical protein
MTAKGTPLLTLKSTNLEQLSGMFLRLKMMMKRWKTAKKKRMRTRMMPPLKLTKQMPLNSKLRSSRLETRTNTVLNLAISMEISSYSTRLSSSFAMISLIWLMPLPDYIYE